ncbi:MAG: hypothetical protein H6Q60_825 [Oscillospiraceae bacterium]|nr:hypothetical protein [Oscillospiraceae bacterium]
MKKRFNLKNPTEVRLLKILAYGEGIITKDQFLTTANKTMLSKYQAANLIAPMPNAPKGVYQVTKKFQALYREQVEPNHHFSGSGSVPHSTALNEILHLVPTDTNITTGQELKRELSQFRNTALYEQRLGDLFEQALRHVDACDHRLTENIGGEKEDECLFNLIDAQKMLDQINHPARRCSPADLMLTFNNNDQFVEFYSEIYTLYQNSQGLTERQQRLFTETLQTLDELEKRPVSAGISLCVEIVTANYSFLDIEQKQSYSYLKGRDIIYIPAQ